MGIARETALALRTIFVEWRILTFRRWTWKCHIIILIKTDLSGFVVNMHERNRKSNPVANTYTHAYAYTYTYTCIIVYHAAVGIIPHKPINHAEILNENIHCWGHRCHQKRVIMSVIHICSTDTLLKIYKSWNLQHHNIQFCMAMGRNYAHMTKLISACQR